MDQISVHDVRKDRRPRNSDPLFHELADDWFFNKFGVRYRSAALFVTSDLRHAARYMGGSGRLVRVIPLSDYSYCWSPRLEDLTYVQSRISVLNAVTVGSQLDAAEYREADLRGAHASGNELMLHCERYVAIPISYLGLETPSLPSLIIPGEY